jgi:hypothetical protein|tara:strand:+ start:52203 stop:52394 length:192 start_codon:yes stop_codon:yes gene_type:complete
MDEEGNLGQRVAVLETVVKVHEKELALRPTKGEILWMRWMLLCMATGFAGVIGQLFIKKLGLA